MSRFIPTDKENVFTFTTGNDIIDRHFDVSNRIYYDDSVRYVNIVSGNLSHNIYWDRTDNLLVLLEDGIQYHVTDFSGEVLNTITTWYDPNWYPLSDRSSDLCHVYVDSMNNNISTYILYDKKHEYTLRYYLENINLFYALEHKLYGTTRSDIEFAILEHRIRNIEVYSLYPDGSQIHGIRTGKGKLVAVLGGIAYQITNLDYDNYLEYGLLDDVEIIRSVKPAV